MAWKISHLIKRLTEVQENFGDIDVVVGEINGSYQYRLDVNVRSAGVIGTSDNWDEKAAVVQAYTIINR